MKNRFLKLATMLQKVDETKRICTVKGKSQLVSTTFYNKKGHLEDAYNLMQMNRSS